MSFFLSLPDTDLGVTSFFMYTILVMHAELVLSSMLHTPGALCAHTWHCLKR